MEPLTPRNRDRKQEAIVCALPSGDTVLLCRQPVWRGARPRGGQGSVRCHRTRGRSHTKACTAELCKRVGRTAELCDQIVRTAIDTLEKKETI